MSSDNQSAELRTAAYVINLTASVINSTVPPEKPNELEWKAVIDFADRQSVLNIVAYAAEGLTQKPDPYTMKYLREFRQQKMIVEAQQEIEACDVMDKLEKMKIRHMPLKGFIVKNLYPSPDMRSMGDIDILVDPEHCDEAVAAFRADGFTFCAEGDLHSNIERGNAYIELHRAMVNEKHKRLSAYFGSGFERAIKTDGFSFRYELSHEDLYIFLIAHVAKHYRYGGTGIRSLLDLYVYRRAYPNLRRDYINGELEKIGLAEFAEKIEAIADDWYSGDFNGSFTDVSSYIVSGGVYGKAEAITQNNFILSNSDENLSRKKLSLIINDLFPGREIMEIRYPVLKKYRFLMPLFWLVRAVQTLFSAPANIKGRAQNAAAVYKVDDDMINAHKHSGIDEL